MTNVAETLSVRRCREKDSYALFEPRPEHVIDVVVKYIRHLENATEYAETNEAITVQTLRDDNAVRMLLEEANTTLDKILMFAVAQKCLACSANLSGAASPTKVRKNTFSRVNDYLEDKTGLDLDGDGAVGGIPGVPDSATVTVTREGKSGDETCK